MNGSDCNGDITSDVTRYILLDLDQKSLNSTAVRLEQVGSLAMGGLGGYSQFARLFFLFQHLLFLYIIPQRCGPRSLHHCPEHHVFANGTKVLREAPGFPHEAYITTSAGLRYEREVISFKG
jgi:hypothetical protein